MGFSTGLHALCQAPHACAAYGTPASSRHVSARTCHTAGWSRWNPYAQAPPRVTAPDLRSAATASASPGGAPENTALTTRSANATAHAVGRAQSRPVLSQIWPASPKSASFSRAQEAP